MADAIVAYVHYLGMMCAFAALIAELLLLAGGLDQKRARQLVNIDLAYWVALALVLVSGVIRLTSLGKGTPFYAENPLFHAKMGLFVGVAVLSLYPSLKLARLRGRLRHRAAPDLGARASRVAAVMRVQIGGLILIPLLAVLMGRGFGY
jgi:putative membrane protein